VGQTYFLASFSLFVSSTQKFLKKPKSEAAAAAGGWGEAAAAAFFVILFLRFLKFYLFCFAQKTERIFALVFFL